MEEAAENLWREWTAWAKAQGRGRAALVAGGETQLAVPEGSGRGGRNHELALRLAQKMEANPACPAAFLALGTDGLDGTSGGAGAIAYPDTVSRARALSLDPEAAKKDHDTGAFFYALGDQIPALSTGTNVMDLMIFLSEGNEPSTPRG